MKRTPRTPDGTRLYAVGDIHGRLDLLTRLLAMIESDALAYPEKSKKLIFLGDYVDRGLDSKGVIARLLGEFAAGLEPAFIRGNHDEMLRQFIEGDLDVAPGWIQLGGASTLASYGVNPFAPGAGNKNQKLRDDLLARMPPEHKEFLDNTVFSVSFGDYYFVHAGVRPGIPLSDQKPDDQMWIRGDFLFSSSDFDKMVVHGHTIKTEPEDKENRIGIDTGAFATGRLTCLVLDGEEKSFLAT